MDREEREIIKKYSRKIEREINSDNGKKRGNTDYLAFRREALHELSWYEGICKLFGRVLKVNIKDKDRRELQKAINATHLGITPEEAGGFASVAVGGFILIVIGFTLLLWLFAKIDAVYFLIPLLLILISLLLIKPLTKIPRHIENKYRLKASNQMVLCILYIVMYMRHTSNLEHAI